MTASAAAAVAAAIAEAALDCAPVPVCVWVQAADVCTVAVAAGKTRVASLPAGADNAADRSA